MVACNDIIGEAGTGGAGSAVGACRTHHQRVLRCRAVAPVRVRGGDGTRRRATCGYGSYTAYRRTGRALGETECHEILAICPIIYAVVIESKASGSAALLTALPPRLALIKDEPKPAGSGQNRTRGTSTGSPKEASLWSILKRNSRQCSADKHRVCKVFIVSSPV